VRGVLKRGDESPGETVFIRNFGCPSSLVDAGFMERALIGAGYRISDNPASADFLIYNTCGVKTPTEDRIIGLMKNVPKTKHLLITGCLPVINLERLRKEVNFSGISGPSTGPEIVNILSRVKRGLKVTELRTAWKLEPLLPNPRSGQLISIIPVAYGCLSSCSYCCVKTARGRLRSYPIEEIATRLRGDVEKGSREFWLTGQDVGCYGHDLGTSLTELLDRISRIDGKFRVRVGMMNPEHLVKIQDELVEAFKSEKIFKFLHIPVQSGDDGILEYMNRAYSVEDIKQIVLAFRERIKRITIATDIIYGFPGENREAFENTIQLLRELKPDVLNISRFSARPRTPLSEARRVPPHEEKRRSRTLTDLSREIALTQNRGWIGWKGEALIDEIGKGDSWIGRNHAYRPVAIRDERNLLGKFVNVRICEAAPTYLMGKTL